MYHLIVAYSPDAYDGDPITLERNRVLHEYTSETLSERHAQLTEVSITELKRFPALFAYEHSNRKDARLGWITKVQARSDAVRFSYKLEESFPPISWERIRALEWDLDIDNSELNRTHWALKDVELFDVLLEDGILSEDRLLAAPPDGPLLRYMQPARAQIEAAPTVFRVPAEPKNPRLVSVMMPFGAALDPVYATIGKVCRKLGLDCNRADDIFDHSEVFQDVFSLIYRSRVVVCDFSGSNPNVYYEAGIAHTLGRPVVPLTQVQEHVTFDLRHHRFIQYLNNQEGLQALEPKLESRLSRLFRMPSP